MSSSSLNSLLIAMLYRDIKLFWLKFKIQNFEKKKEKIELDCV